MWDFFVKYYLEGDLRDNKYSYFIWRIREGRYWVGQSGVLVGFMLFGVYYLCGFIFGGLFMINVMVIWLLSDSDWNFYVNVIGDDSWWCVNLFCFFLC